jgi:hypothetical protein
MLSHLQINDTFIPIRYIKYFIDGKKYIMATTLFDSTNEEIKMLYKLRWRVELSFKRLKSHLHIEKIHSISEKNWLQDLQFRILFDTIVRQKQIHHTNQKNQKNENKSYKIILYNIFETVKNDLQLHFIKFRNKITNKDQIHHDINEF